MPPKFTNCMFCWGWEVYLMALPQMSYAHANSNPIEGYLMALLHMSYAHVNFNPRGISDGSAANVIWTCEHWGYLMALLHMSYAHVSFNPRGISDGSATNVIWTCEHWGVSDGSAAHVICTCELQSQGEYLIALPEMSSEHVNTGGVSDGSATNVIWTCETQGGYLMDVIWKFELISGFTLASQRSFLWKTNKG